MLKGRHAIFGSATAWYLATDMPPTWLFQAAVPILAFCLQFAVRAFCDAARINTRKKKMVSVCHTVRTAPQHVVCWSLWDLLHPWVPALICIWCMGAWCRPTVHT
jgi:hypothetical protein